MVSALYIGLAAPQVSTNENLHSVDHYCIKKYVNWVANLLYPKQRTLLYRSYRGTMQVLLLVVMHLFSGLVTFLLPPFNY